MSDFLAPSRGLRRDRSVAGLLGGRVKSIWFTRAREGRTVIGWGHKRSGRRAEALARRSGADLLLLEDGFLRSVGRNDPRIGINFDNGGIYYDATSNSRLFTLIRQDLDEAQVARARNVMADWRRYSLSKYNDARDPDIALPTDYVLVIDQVRDDLSITSGLANADHFDAMLTVALSENLDRQVVVKLHPDALDNPAKRHFDIARLEAEPRVTVIADHCHVAPLVAGASAVYAVTSQVGFEALMWGKRVRTFGMPFYAGWGLTEDTHSPPEGRRSVTLEALVHAALIDYPRYWHPVRQVEIDVEEAMAFVGLNRSLRNELPRRLVAVGFSPWKRPFVRQFLTGSDVDFVTPDAGLAEGADLVLWGRNPVPDGARGARARWLEDGFLRSVGLGADLIRPLSLVVDGPGIYYDATGPSRLEHYLANHDFTPPERARAASLRNRIVALRLSKYNLSGGEWHRPAGAEYVVLVVGQVADDASIRLGSPDLKSGGALLRRVRAECPNATIVYRPHPDVVAGLRDAGSDDAAAAALADHVVSDADPMQLVEQIDEVHVMTSLMGFEALMRGKKVVCHGLPFYAGWGLTEDRLEAPRRGRSLALDELVHGALIAYPRYFSQRAGLFAAPEDILEELTSPPPGAHSPWRKALRPLLKFLRPAPRA